MGSKKDNVTGDVTFPVLTSRAVTDYVIAEEDVPIGKSAGWTGL